MVEVQLDAHWTKVVKAMAEAKAEEQEWQAQQARFLTWIDWLHDGPTYGSRKQHQLTKVKGGCVEASIIDCRELSEAEIQIEDGLSPEQLRTALHLAAIEQQPASIQEETDMEAKRWHSE